MESLSRKMIISDSHYTKCPGITIEKRGRQRLEGRKLIKKTLQKRKFRCSKISKYQNSKKYIYEAEPIQYNACLDVGNNRESKIVPRFLFE